MSSKKILKKIKFSEQNISTLLGALVIIVIGILIFNYFRGVNKSSQTTSVNTQDRSKLTKQNGQVVPDGLPTKHIVAQRENLWQIAEKYFGSGYNWVDIASENKLGNPNRLLVGQEINIPRVAVKSVKAASINSEPQTIQSETYTIVKGDKLWNIAVRAYGDGFQWVKIAKANGLKNPDVIHPGNSLKIPR